MDNSSRDSNLHKYLEEYIREGYVECLYNPDIDSIIALSILVRALNANSVNIGISSIYEIQDHSETKYSNIGIGTVLIGNRSISIARNASHSTHSSNVIKPQGSITEYVFSSISKIYKLPKDLRSISVVGHLYHYTDNGLLSGVDDRYIKDLGNIFGEDSIAIKNGLKVHRYGGEFDLVYVLSNSLDPYIPLSKESIKNIIDATSNETSESTEEVLKEIAKSINEKIGRDLVKKGLKPLYGENYPFIDPYDASICISSIASLDPSTLALYISSGFTGISLLALKCSNIFAEIKNYLDQLLINKEIRSHTISIKGVRMTIYPSLKYSIVRPVHNILSALNHYKGTIPIYDIDGKYVLIIENPSIGEKIMELSIEVTGGGLAIIHDLEKHVEAIKLWSHY